MNKIMTVVFLLAALIGGGFTALAVGPKVATPANSDKIYAEGLQLFGDLGNDGALKRGFKLFQQAAAEGNADAANAVGVAKLFGFGTQMDPAAAARQLGEAADKGSAKASYNLALLFLDGPPPMTDERKALQQMERAAMKGDVPAQYLLGQALLSSNRFDPNAALAWFEKAGRAGDERAAAFAGALHLGGQIDKPNQKLALTLLGQLSQVGNFQAKYFLGEHLAELGTDHADPVKALDYLIQAHELGGRPYPLARARGLIADVAAGKAGLQGTNVQAFLEEKAQRSCVANYLAAELFLLPERIYKDDRKGRSLLEEGVEMGCDLARERLGDIYAKGIGVKKNPSRAQKYYLAAGEGSSDAALKLAIITVELATDARELKVAYQSAVRSAKMGNARAYGVLATILDQEGTGEEDRRVKAYAWALLAAKDLPTVKQGQLADLEKSLTADQLREGKVQAQYLWIMIRSEALKRGEKSFRF